METMLFASDGLSKATPADSITIPSAAGDSADIVARIMGQGLSTRVEQSIVIENHGGDGGINGTEMAARAKPDGYTLSLGSTTTHVLAPLAVELEYDPAEDFDPVTHVATMPYVLAMPAAINVDSVRSSGAMARSRSPAYPISRCCSAFDRTPGNTRKCFRR